MKKFYSSYLTTLEARALINEGYKYSVKCDYVITDATDPWSGMPGVNNNVAVFMDRAEAEAYAAKQMWPFNPDVHSEVKELVWGETWAEMEERMTREKAERKAKKDAKEAEKAAAAGMTVAEYKIAKTKAAKRARLEKEVTRLENELAAARMALAKVDA